MADFVLSCCSTADLTKEHFRQRDISYVCFHYALDGVDYPDDLGESMPFDKFYAAMANGADTRTSQVNISEFVDYFTPFLEQGKDILHVCLSSGLSGVSNSAENAARIVRERYPERKIYIVDSLGASSGYGLLMDRLADLRDEGMPIDGGRAAPLVLLHRPDVLCQGRPHFQGGRRLRRPAGYLPAAEHG